MRRPCFQSSRVFSHDLILRLTGVHDLSLYSLFVCFWKCDNSSDDDNDGMERYNWRCLQSPHSTADCPKCTL